MNHRLFCQFVHEQNGKELLKRKAIINIKNGDKKMGQMTYLFITGGDFS